MIFHLVCVQIAFLLFWPRPQNPAPKWLFVYTTEYWGMAVVFGFCGFK